MSGRGCEIEDQVYVVESKQARGRQHGDLRLLSDRLGPGTAQIAFLIGFQIYLPFLILDIVVSSVTISMGMMMLPPVMISLPLKLLLFVLVDGWNLVVGMLLQSFGAPP